MTDAAGVGLVGGFLAGLALVLSRKKKFLYRAIQKVVEPNTTS